MNAPPAICHACGWSGPAPGIHAENSTGVTFRGMSVSCPNCGRPAEIVSGTYDFVGNTVQLVREANLSLEQIVALRRAAQEARKTGEQPEEFAAAHPAAAPIINMLLQQAPRRDWILILVMVLGLILPYLRAPKVEREQGAPAPTPTTQVLRDEQINQIVQEVTIKLGTGGGPPTVHPRGSGQPQSSKPRRKRPPKTYGKNKLHRRR